MGKTIEEIAGEMRAYACDDLCKWPTSHLTLEQMEKKCNECKLVKFLVKLEGVEELLEGREHV